MSEKRLNRLRQMANELRRAKHYAESDRVQWAADRIVAQDTKLAQVTKERDEATAESAALLRAASINAKCCACYGEGDPDTHPLARTGDFFIHRDLDCIDTRQGKLLGPSPGLDALRVEVIAEHFAAERAAEEAKQL